MNLKIKLHYGLLRKQLHTQTLDPSDLAKSFNFFFFSNVFMLSKLPPPNPKDDPNVEPFFSFLLRSINEPDFTVNAMRISSSPRSLSFLSLPGLLCSLYHFDLGFSYTSISLSGSVTCPKNSSTEKLLRCKHLTTSSARLPLSGMVLFENDCCI